MLPEKAWKEASSPAEQSQLLVNDNVELPPASQKVKPEIDTGDDYGHQHQRKSDPHKPKE